MFPTPARARWSRSTAFTSAGEVTQARGDDDLKSLRGQADFERLISSSSK